MKILALPFIANFDSKLTFIDLEILLFFIFRKNDMSSVNAVENFVLSGAAALLSKTTAAPIERIKIILQNQNELIKQGILERPYSGVTNCATRVFRRDGFLSFWRGNWANCIRYIPTQAMNFTFKDTIKAAFPVNKNSSTSKKLMSNTMAGGCAGALSLLGW